MSALFTWMRLKKRGRPSLYPLNENATRSLEMRFRRRSSDAETAPRGRGAAAGADMAVGECLPGGVGRVRSAGARTTQGQQVHGDSTQSGRDLLNWLV